MIEDFDASMKIIVIGNGTVRNINNNKTKYH